MNYNKKSNLGFTLIEFFVVMTIIGVLVAIVMSVLNSSDDKDKDASVQSSMASMRAQAELGMRPSGIYVVDVCASMATGGLASLSNTVISLGATNSHCAQQGVSGATSTGWAYETTLSTGKLFCVDSTGFAGIVTPVSPDITTITGTKTMENPATVLTSNVGASDFTCN